MDKEPDHYAVLGIARTADAAEVKSAFKKKALEYHPDKNPNGEAMFKRVNMAYGVLSDPVKRSQYDRTRRSSGSGFEYPTRASRSNSQSAFPFEQKAPQFSEKQRRDLEEQIRREQEEYRRRHGSFSGRDFGMWYRQKQREMAEAERASEDAAQLRREAERQREAEQQREDAELRKAAAAQREREKQEFAEFVRLEAARREAEKRREEERERQRLIAVQQQLLEQQRVAAEVERAMEGVRLAREEERRTRQEEMLQLRQTDTEGIQQRRRQREQQAELDRDAADAEGRALETRIEALRERQREAEAVEERRRAEAERQRRQQAEEAERRERLAAELQAEQQRQAAELAARRKQFAGLDRATLGFLKAAQANWAPHELDLPALDAEMEGLEAIYRAMMETPVS